MPNEGIGEFVAYQGDAAKVAEADRVAKPKKWNEFSDIGKIHST
jgi:hypothetical protein